MVEQMKEEPTVWAISVLMNTLCAQAFFNFIGQAYEIKNTPWDAHSHAV